MKAYQTGESNDDSVNYDVNRFILLRMGYTSKQLDEEMTFNDTQLLLALHAAEEEMEMKKIAAAVAMVFSKMSMGGEKRGRRR